MESIVISKDIKLKDILDMGNGLNSGGKMYYNSPFWFEDWTETTYRLYFPTDLPEHIKKEIKYNPDGTIEFFPDDIKV